MLYIASLYTRVSIIDHILRYIMNVGVSASYVKSSKFKVWRLLFVTKTRVEIRFCIITTSIKNCG